MQKSVVNFESEVDLEREFARNLKLVGALPNFTFLFSLVMHLLIALKFGHFPTYENPQPADVTELSILGALPLIGVGLSLFVVPVYVCFLIVYIYSQYSNFGLTQFKTILKTSFGSFFFIAALKIPQIENLLFWIFD